MSASAPAESTLPQSWAELIPSATRVRIAVVAALLLIIYWIPIRYNLIGRWAEDGNWSHGFLIPLFGLYFLAERREELSRITVKANYAGAVVLGLSLMMYFFFAWRLPMAYPRAVSLVGSIFGVTLLLGGWSVIRVAWFPIAFLLLAIPLPQQQYVNITMPMREWASTAAASLMPLFVDGLHTESQAVVIDYVLPGKAPGTLNIEEACSGMRLTMAFVTLGVAMAYLRERPLWQRVVLVVACIPIAVFCNTIRVTVTGLLFVHDLEDWARGTPHSLLGLIMLVIALGLFALIAWVLSRLFVEETQDETTEPQSS